MLCCGIVACLVAALAGWWRHLDLRFDRRLIAGWRGNRRGVMIACAAVLLSLPVAVLALAGPPAEHRLDRGNIVIMAMRAIC